MTHADWLAILQAAVPSVVAGIVGWILRTGQIEMHVNMNSRLDELRKSDRALGHAEGVAQGRSEGANKT